MDPALTGALVKALAAARAEFQSIVKNKSAKIPMKSGGIFSFNYADLPAIIDATYPALSRHGLVVTQWIGIENGQKVLNTQIFHEAGGCLPASQYPLSRSGDMKEVGGELTYLRRYCYAAALNIASDDDNDIQGMKEPNPAKPKATPAPRQSRTLAEQVKELVAHAQANGLQVAQVKSLCELNSLPSTAAGYTDPAQVTTLAAVIEDAIAMGAENSQLDDEGVA